MARSIILPCLVLAIAACALPAASAQPADLGPGAQITSRAPVLSAADGSDGARPRMLLAVYSALIVAASLSGGWLPFLFHFTHTRMQLLVSLVAGLMLGIAVFHLLPHALHEMGPDEKAVDRVAIWLMAGLLGMFFLIRAFHFHQHSAVEVLDEHRHEGHEHAHHHHAHRHHDASPAACSHQRAHLHALSWIGVAFGLAVHTLIDGIALAASVQAEAGHGAEWALYGLGTFVAIMLHKPLDAISITSLMAASGWSAGWRHGVNLAFALMCPLGAALFWLGVRQFSESQSLIVGCALAAAAGVFLCISLGDLLPELEFHSHDRLTLSAALLLGVALAYGIGFLEPEHAHSHVDAPAAALSRTPGTAP